MKDKEIRVFVKNQLACQLCEQYNECDRRPNSDLVICSRKLELVRALFALKQPDGSPSIVMLGNQEEGLAYLDYVANKIDEIGKLAEENFENLRKWQQYKNKQNDLCQFLTGFNFAERKGFRKVLLWED